MHTDPIHPDETAPEPSTVKVRRAISRLFAELPSLQQQASGLNAMMLAPLMGLAPRLEAELLERLPDDPAILDLLIDRAAALVLELRSDVVDVVDVAELAGGES